MLDKCLELVMIWDYTKAKAVAGGESKTYDQMVIFAHRHLQAHFT